ncbi:MAG: hypothetical protein K2N01_01360 [Lachnospiraceae bacterium]|nr:hypothetical protein [Lachnospiraceae bacterium]
MKKKPWVKVAAVTLALALLWMNMADVRNILDANAETGEQQTETEQPLAETEEPLIEPKQPPIESEESPVESEQSPAESESSSVEDKANFDITAPVVDIISIDKQGKTLKDGDTVTISVKAYDPESGVESVMIDMDNYNGSYGSYIWLEYNEVDQKWEKTLKIEDFGKGKCYIYEIEVVNGTKMCTHANVYDGEALYWFTVDREEKSEVGVMGPTVDEVTLKEKGTVLKPGDMVHVEVKASAGEKELSTQQHCYIYIDGVPCADRTRCEKKVNLEWNEEKQCYRGSAEITETMYPGTWSVHGMYLDDVSGNSWDCYDNWEKDNKFVVQNDAYDVELPQVQQITMDKRGEIVSPGDSVKLSVKATDNEGIASIEVYLVARKGGLIYYNETISLERVGDTDEYVGVFTVGELTFPCEWYVYYIYLRDTSANHRYIYSCKDGEYSDYNSLITYSKDTYLLRERFYVDVVQTGNVFVNSTTTVAVYGYLQSGDSWMYGYLGAIEIPSRATGSEIFPTIKEQYGKTLPEGIAIKGCVSSRGTSDTGEDPVFLWQNSQVNILYNKNIIMLTLHDSYDSMNFMYYPVLYQGMIAGKEGEILELPKELPGLRNIEWKTFDGLKYSATETIEVGSDPVQYVYGCAEVDSDAPVTPDTPDAPYTPVNPSPTGPVTLPYQKIAEVSAEIAAAGNGAVITVDMGDATVVPKDILETAKGKEVKVVLEMDGYTWSIDGKDILSSNLKDINLKVIRNTDYIPSGLISQLAGTNPVEQITLEYNGDFGFKADLTMNIGSQYAGKTGSLYWHDSDGRMIFMNAGAIDTVGNVTLGFSHASDYAVVITEPVATAAPNAAAVSVTKPTAVAPKTGDTTPIAFYAILLIAALAACGLSVYGTVVYRRKRSRRNS